jgi:hypothetical protein
MEFEFEYSQFSKLLDVCITCLPSVKAMKNFSRVEFCDEILGKSGRIRFSDIHNPMRRFLHRWMSFTLFPMREPCYVTVAKFRCMFSMVRRIKYTPVADIVDYFKETCTLSGTIECTSMVT